MAPTDAALNVTPAVKNLLVELLVEELPPKVLRQLGEAFGANLLAALRAQGLASEGSALNLFATPRRLAARISHVLERAPDTLQAIKLMPVSVGLDAEGRATPALLKKLALLSADASAVADLRRAADGKSEALYFDSSKAGATLADGLQQALAEALVKLPIPKVMQYQLADGWTSVSFVRPAHGLVALHGADVVPVTALGLAAGRQTQGHRFEARVDPVVLQDADHYEHQLEAQGAVIADFSHRRSEIVRQLQAAAAAGLVPIDDDALLDEVTALVELPNVLACRFEPEFLAVPPECLILTMKANQKYFPLLDAEGKLTERFLIVSNIRPADPARVIEGNERVVRPRLADARFFYDQDRKCTLASRVPDLARVVYHGKLGSQGERVERVRALARHIGQALGGAELAAQADRAALLAKADLLSAMVGEFPELQGVMGGYYARHDGEPEAVALAIEDHYKPRFAGDSLPRALAGRAGVVLALADKLETLSALFGIDQVPTGDKDPFALRRHALGVIRLLIECALPLSLPSLLEQAFAAFPKAGADAPAALLTFIYDRLVGYLRDQGYSAQEVDAVVAVRPPWGELMQRLAAVRLFADLPEAEALAAANKRVANILKKSDAASNAKVEAALLSEPAELALAEALARTAPAADAAFERGDYAASLQTLAALKLPVDAFFEGVMVNADDAALRRNRLALLAQLHGAMNRVADLSRLV
ncbi:MAG: glycine--tRNA ligase subunit beta [Pseudomonadota bacterium]|nr:glycine--tRNA ligase subunit beta [Pseudomonadota bacterium]